MQSNLFTNHTDPSEFETHLLGDGWIREYGQAFAPEQSRVLLEQLIREVPWRQDHILIAGKVLPVPRLQCWMGSAGYSYSGISLQAEAWHPAVLDILAQVTRLSGYRFNSVLLNYYRNGQDSVSWHADDEPELGPDPIIASVSLGAERLFQLRTKTPRTGAQEQQKYRLSLRDGSILLMGNNIQNRWLHQLPKVKGLEQPRINLTFRQLRDSQPPGRAETVNQDTDK